MCPKVRQGPYKVRQVQYKISEIQVFAGTALYLYLPENILLSACNFLPNYCFFVSSVHLLVKAGYGCSLLVASNVFVRTKPYLLFLNKNDAPHECGNPKCKARALGWLSDERFPRACSTSAGCFACCAILAGARKLLVSATDAELHPRACVVPGNAPS